MAWLNGVLLVYALLNIFGGVIGYLQKGSMMSVIAGVATGALVLGCAALAKSNPKIGYGLALVPALATAGWFIRTYMKTQAIWPPMVMIVASVAVLIALVAGHFMQGAAKTAN